MPSKPLSRKLKVGVMRGGPSRQYDASLKTGKHVLDNLRKMDGYEPRDIFIDKEGAWHIDGVVRPAERIFPHVDVMFNALHGSFGEDGRVQKLLETHNVPFTGSKSLGSSLGMNKPVAKKHYRMHGLLIPEHVVIQKDEYELDTLRKILEKYPYLKFVKPAASGSAFGVSSFGNFDELKAAVDRAFSFSDSVMIEEFIKGYGVTCCVIEGSATADIHALQPIGTRSTASYPRDLTPEEQEIIKRAAVIAHQALGLRHYSESDFIVNRIGVYILETNTLPSLAPESAFPKALSVSNISSQEFLDHVITLAFERG